MSRWSEFYKPKMNPASQLAFKEKYWPYLSELMLATMGHKTQTIIEAGCGTGLVSKFLVEMTGHGNHILYDQDEDVLALAAINDPVAKVGGWSLKLENQDILKPFKHKADFIHSHGVLEHFCDEDIQMIVNNCREVAPVVYAFVPSDKYEYKSFGDERLMSKEEWKMICFPTEIQEFNQGKDLILKWR